jgi:arginyl-tRNA synthetase
MNISLYLQSKIKTALEKLSTELDINSIVIERSKDPVHGDYATNVAMQLSKILKKNPRQIATELVEALDKTDIEKIEIAGPGFINFFMTSEYLSSIIDDVFEEQADYGRLKSQNREHINVEFVSANPTGELHLGHARIAAIGDVICRLYEARGFKVTREYYVNDAGVQIYNLAQSIYSRYLGLFGIDRPIPQDGYHSVKIIEVAQIIKNEVGDKFLNDEEAAIAYMTKRGVELELEGINRDLQLFKVNFDIFSSEVEIRANQRVEKFVSSLGDRAYVLDDATFLKTTLHGDDKDRVIVKSNGEFTYFTPDIVYHLDKLSRGYDKLIDVLGADHHGYIARMKAALMMFGYPSDVLHVELIQMVRLIQNGQEVKMSKRTGNAITLRELVEEVGVDAVRYFFVARAASGHLDFDIDLAKEASTANPLYYAQYAHARLATVLASALEKGFVIDKDPTKLTRNEEKELLKHVIDFAVTVEDAALTRSPYKVANYVQRLASLIHTFYTECRILDSEDVKTTASRLALAKASMIVMANALGLLGVSAPNKM